MSFKHILLWLPMIVLAVLNGTFRQLFLTKYYSELTAHQLSTFTLTVLCAIYTAVVFPFLAIRGSKQALLVGFIWVILTVSFEFLLGRLTGKSWAYLLKDYDLVAGHIWPVFLICLLLLPYVFFSLKSISR
jgi:hypothetical protein